MAEVQQQHVPQSGEISLESFCDMLEQAAVRDTIDLGGVIAYRVTHPEHGDLILMNTPERSGVIRL